MTRRNALRGFLGAIAATQLPTPSNAKDLSVIHIYYKPTRAIKYINLNFIKVPAGAKFDEVVGSL